MASCYASRPVSGSVPKNHSYMAPLVYTRHTGLCFNRLRGCRQLSAVIKPSDELSIQMLLFAVPVTSYNGHRGVVSVGISAVACNVASLRGPVVGRGREDFVQSC